MATRVSLETLPDGRVAVVKVALTGDRQDRRAEAKWLADARHRGVVQLLGIDDDPVTLRTLHAGGTTMRTARPSPALAAFLLADVAVTLADLHERGFVHGQITLDHLVICDNRIAICSPSGTETESSVDLADFGLCIETLIQRWRSDRIDIPELRSWQRVCSRLQSLDEAYSARRAARELAKLGARCEIDARADKPMKREEASNERRTTLLRQAPVGLLAGAGVFMAAILGLLFLTSQPGSTQRKDATAIEVLIGTDRYRILGSTGDRAIALGPTCGAGQTVAYLNIDTSAVWIFSNPEANPTELAIVPGATSIEATSRCDRLGLVGPAGKTELSLDR